MSGSGVTPPMHSGVNSENQNREVAAVTPSSALGSQPAVSVDLVGVASEQESSERANQGTNVRGAADGAAYEDGNGASHNIGDDADQDTHNHTMNASVNGDSSGGASHSPQQDFASFCDRVLNVDKSIVGAENDPTYELLLAAAETAQEPFWASAADTSNATHLENLVKRCRNWISVLARKKSFEKTIPALYVLQKLPLDNAMVKRIGIPSTVNNLLSLTDTKNVHAAAKGLTDKYKDAFLSEENAKSSAASRASPAPKLFSEMGALKLRTHKRARERSPPTSPPLGNVADQDNAKDTEDTTNEPRSKRAKTKKRVHWKPDAELVAVRIFEMDGIAKFKSAKNARQQEHDEGSAMHPRVEWVTPSNLDFTGMFGTEQLRSLMSTRRGGTKVPSSADDSLETLRDTQPPSTSTNHMLESPREPPAHEIAPDPSWKPRDGGKFTPATPPREWLQKHNGVNPAMNPNMNPMAPMMSQMPPMMPQMMPTFPWGMNYPMNMNMNMGMSPAQMNEMMKMGGNMFGKP